MAAVEPSGAKVAIFDVQKVEGKELADALARRGVPFRQAHEIAGRRFAAAEAAGLGLLELPPSDGVTGADLASVDLGRALARRGAAGGTSPKRVAQAARKAAARVEAGRKAAAPGAAARSRG